VVLGVGGLVIGELFSPLRRAGLIHQENLALPPASASPSQKQLWTCGMHPQVIQDQPGECPICHMQLTPLAADIATPSSPLQAKKIKYWWDPMMTPPYISDKPGKSPMGMDLVPVYEDQVAAGLRVTINPVVVQNMGVRLDSVREEPIERRIRVVGYLEEPQPLHRDINLRVSGWIETLHANVDGMLVKAGQPLFDLYSPEIQVAVEELLAAGRAAGSAESSKTLYEASVRKLQLWGLEDRQIEDLAKLEHAPATVSFLAPMSGHLTEKRVYAGAAVKAGDLVLRIADRSRMWLDAAVYETQLPLIKLGSQVTAIVLSQPGKVFEGQVIFIHPHIDPTTRTARVRIEIPNEDYLLRQGMYATVEVRAEASQKTLVVPREAVIDTGTRQIVFVALDGGRFEPRQVRVGTSGNGKVQILSGLMPAEEVVISGQFLLDSESRLKEAIQKYLQGGLTTPDPPVATQPESPTTLPTVTPSHSPPAAPHIDDLFSAYLALARSLGAKQTHDEPLSIASLIEVAEAAVEQSQGDAHSLAIAVLNHAQAMRGRSLVEQRKLFKPLSQAILGLMDRSPPSEKVAPRLFAIFCPMALDDEGAEWLQDSEEIANPYFATQMKHCGEITRSVTPRSNRP
jgi:Cu(I)/Ag(I) efflux system membrane fusion protein/cobalt-zinc-cadmium efflux system membrane fusion protein